MHNNLRYKQTLAAYFYHSLSYFFFFTKEVLYWYIFIHIQYSIKNLKVYLLKKHCFCWTGKQYDQYSPLPRDSAAYDFNVVYQDPESLIVAMERVTVLFDR